MKPRRRTLRRRAAMLRAIRRNSAWFRAPPRDDLDALAHSGSGAAGAVVCLAVLACMWGLWWVAR